MQCYPLWNIIPFILLSKELKLFFLGSALFRIMVCDMQSRKNLLETPHAMRSHSHIKMSAHISALSFLFILY